MIYLDWPTNSCKSAQYSCFTLWCVGITKNTSGNLVGVKLGFFQKSVSELFLKMVMFRVEDNVKRKLFNYKVVGNFATNVLDIKFSWFRVRTGLLGPIYCSPRWGDGNPRSYIKGGNLIRPGHLHPRICSHQSHVFASPMDPISMGKGSQESMKEGC